jgi:hypothetical protein
MRHVTPTQTFELRSIEAEVDGSRLSAAPPVRAFTVSRRASPMFELRPQPHAQRRSGSKDDAYGNLLCRGEFLREIESSGQNDKDAGIQ